LEITAAGDAGAEVLIWESDEAFGAD